ncbi:MAG: AI-2E family transporter, partial [Lachnospiraceae bacterium]|nr:AI-2E family transporter [Lachnospiraceae bacterium]
MKFNKNLLKEKWVAYTIALCTAVLLYMVLTHLGTLAGILGKLWKVCSPVIMAFVIAFVLDPLVKIYTKYVFNGISSDRLRHNLSVILTFVTVIVFFAILMVALVPQIVDSAVTFAGNLNSYVRSFQGLMRQLNRFALNHD